MSPELELLDQLQGGDMPLGVLVALFPDESHARRAIKAMLLAGELELLDSQVGRVAAWQLLELEAQSNPWRTETRYRLAITDAGKKRIGG
jgi:hypothetical protein